MTDTHRILLINASARTTASDSRKLGAELVAQLKQSYQTTTGTTPEIIERDLAATPVPQVSDMWVAGNFTDDAVRTDEHRDALALSDALIAELKSADTVIIASPIYNFAVPAALKAYIDQIARARVTFRYTENGPVGLLEGKKAYIVLTSGGVAMDSEADFATQYLKFILGFVGITDVQMVDATSLGRNADARLTAARGAIAQIAA